MTARFEYKERKGGDELLINNPLSSDSGFHFNINTKLGVVHDWRGDDWVGTDSKTGKARKKTFLRFVQLYREREKGSCSYLEALQDITGSSLTAKSILAAANSNKDAPPPVSISDIELPPGSVMLDDPSDQLQAPTINYLMNRGLSLDTIKRYKVMASGLSATWPYYEFDELVYWQSRSITNKRFTFPPESCGRVKSDYLYGIDYVEPASHLIIVEAIIDCLTISEQAVAIGGATLSKRQVQIIRMLGPTDGVILAADNDKAGLGSIRINAEALSPYFAKIYWTIPPSMGGSAKDWNDIRCRTNLSVLETLEKNIRPYDTRGKVELARLISAS